MAQLRRAGGGSPGGRLLGPPLRSGGPPSLPPLGPRAESPPSGPRPSSVCGPAPACRLRRRSASACSRPALRPAPSRGRSSASGRAGGRPLSPLPRRAPPAACPWPRPCPAVCRLGAAPSPWFGPCPRAAAGPPLPPARAGPPPASLGRLRSGPGGAAGAAVPAAPVPAPPPRAVGPVWLLLPLWAAFSPCLPPAPAPPAGGLRGA